MLSSLWISLVSKLFLLPNDGYLIIFLFNNMKRTRFSVSSMTSTQIKKSNSIVFVDVSTGIFYIESQIYVMILEFKIN